VVQRLPKFDSYTGLSVEGRRAFFAVAGGQILNAYVSAGLSFILVAVTAAFSLSATQAGLLATVSVVATAVGGTLGGTLADRLGRVRVLLISTAAFGLCNFLAGWTQTYEQLLLLRTIQGAGVGGLVAAGSVLMAEYSQETTRGRVLGIMQSAYPLGYVLLLIAYPVVFAMAPPEHAWRIMLWLSILPTLPLLWLVMRVPESPVFKDYVLARASAPNQVARQQISLLRLFGPDLLIITLAAILLSLGARGGGTDFWIPSFLEQVHGLAPASISIFMSMMVLGAVLGGFAGGFVVDAIGRRRGMAVLAVAGALSVWAYTAVPEGEHVRLLLLGVPYAFFTSSISGGLGSYLSELFPTAVRGAGQGLSGNIGEIGRAIGPLMVGLIAGRAGLGRAIDVAGASYGLCLIALPFLPETRGKKFDDDDAPALA
jgi:MFS family permease